MKSKENSLNHINNYKISKTGLLENDKKLLINKLGLNNLSHLNITEEKNNINNFCKNINSVSNLKKDINHLNKPSKLIKITKEHSNFLLFKDISTNPNIKNENNISFFSPNQILIEFHNYKKISNQKKISLKKKLMYNNKSYSNLPINPLIDNKKMGNISLNKKQNNINKKDMNNNYFKVNINNNPISQLNHKRCPIRDSSDINPQIKLIKNSKKIKEIKNVKDKLICAMSTPNLLFDMKNQKIKNKQQSFKIFNDSILVNNNLYNKNAQTKYKGVTTNNSPKNVINKFNFLSKEEEKKLIVNHNNNISKIKKKNNILQDRYIKNNSSSPNLKNINNKNINKNYEREKSTNSANDENSDETRKESGLNIYKYFNDNNNINTDNINNINEIISNNMKMNYSGQNTNYNRENSKLYNEMRNKEKQKNINYFNNLNKNNDEQNFDSSKNENFSFVKENNDNNNINNNCQSSKIIVHIQDVQNSQDKNSGQTCMTDEKNNKISKYKEQPIYDLSPRYVYDEIIFPKNEVPIKKFKFINDVIMQNKNIPLIEIKKILKLNDKSIFKLLSFSYDNYSSIISSNILLKNKINISLINMFQHVIDDFKLKYKNFLKVLNFTFKQNSINIKDKLSYLFNLVIECQIITKDIRKSFEIGCDYISGGKKYDNKWKFDVQNKEDIKIWLCTELDVVNNLFKNFSYTSQVPSFCYQDKFELQFNIFSKGNSIDPNSIEWIVPTITKVKPEIYQNSNFISSLSFDRLRDCEVETQILFWKNNLPKDDKGIVNDFIKTYEKLFKIKNISYDISKYYFYRFSTIAYKKGLLKQNKFSTFDINIVESKNNIKNEIQCIFLMNSSFYSKTMEIRLGTNVTFYIIDMKR